MGEKFIFGLTSGVLYLVYFLGRPPTVSNKKAAVKDCYVVEVNKVAQELSTEDPFVSLSSLRMHHCRVYFLTYLFVEKRQIPTFENLLHLVSSLPSFFAWP